jgi:hypothetical protein
MGYTKYIIAVVVLVLLYHPAVVDAQARAPLAQTPSLEEQMKPQCRLVQRNLDGTWTIKGKIELQNRGSVVGASQGNRIGKGVSLEGIDIADLFEHVCTAHQT